MLRSIVSSIEFIIRPNFLTSNSRYLKKIFFEVLFIFFEAVFVNQTKGDFADTFKKLQVLWRFKSICFYKFLVKI
ncbi:hypothetical protein MAL08_13965 [Leptospira noguchii]|uniref:hypothetical protein n=1 Tax=Leptospira noguchii TaxID=28182 RepID=UPI001FB78350|nr:hypothetical protein [Leptospira noguchii]UOG37162.1 hypothetical protein MAL08_13965 [Leptospira noguchii]